MKTFMINLYKEAYPELDCYMSQNNFEVMSKDQEYI